ncbi:hypothetical protein [Streptomyces sp. S.PB5]|uniref:DUF7660 family protein n=1 Tax=Streptomyces sp. S.PB5 TaxID=3020844 RepID=UPI0025B11AA4|nr:hypothetical protein [Streptomyces sp. S.PB5]MDN3025757.1 hypothetical protein [Streptomyces sp. S.PB5]
MTLGAHDEIPTREDLAAFVRALHEEYLQRGDEWENRTLDTFLEALSAWIDSAPGWYRNFGKELPAGGDWTFLARALSAATVYE